MLRLAALIVVAGALAACDGLAPAAPAAPDASRPSLFGGPPPVRPAPAAEVDGGSSALGGAAGGLPADADGTPALPAWTPGPAAAQRNSLLRPYPSQGQVLGQQRMLLGNDIRQQEAGRDSLSLQLQQGMERDRLDAARLQQQIDQDRARNP
jgi:hypothetical protein